MNLLGSEGVYTSERIDAGTLPKGYKRYELGFGSDKRFDVVSADTCKHYAGAFITKKPLNLGSQKQVTLKESDYSIAEDRPFDFESYWGCMVSLDKKISDANIVRDQAMGKAPFVRDPQQSKTIDDKELSI